jgi:hypothetical protein
VLCGYTPTADVSLHQFRGVLILPMWRRDKGPFCRTCGLTTFRDRTATTLAWTFWSVISVVLVPVTLFLNLRARRQLTSLAPPAERADVITPNRAPLPPGKPVLARPMSVLSPLLLTGVLAVLFTLNWPSREPLDVVGGCVELSSSRIRDEVRFVRCDQPHHAVITDIVDDWSKCPGPDPAYAEFGYRYFCLAGRVK